MLSATHIGRMCDHVSACSDSKLNKYAKLGNIIFDKKYLYLDWSYWFPLEKFGVRTTGYLYASIRSMQYCWIGDKPHDTKLAKIILSVDPHLMEKYRC